MPNEVILCGFKVQLPLTPEDRLKIEMIALGLDQMMDRLSGTGAFFVPKHVPAAVAAMRDMARSLLDADDAIAAPRLQTPRS